MERQIIYPNIKKSTMIVSFRNVKIIEYILFISAFISCELYDENDKFVEERFFTLDNSNGLSQWGADDKFIINFIKAELGKV